MKKLVLFLLACGLAALSRAETVLETSVKATTTTTEIVVSKVIAQPNADGTMRLTVIPVAIRRDADGVETHDFNVASFEITLTPAQFAPITAVVKAAYAAKLAARAAPKTTSNTLRWNPDRYAGLVAK